MTGLRLMLVRHGETESNVRLTLDTVPPGPPLTEEGTRQAQRLGESLATEPVVAVYASRALRAQLTAAPVAEQHQLDVEVLDGVHEVFVGDLEGASDLESLGRFAEVYGAWQGGDLEQCCPNGETGRQVVDRFVQVIDKLRARHRSGTVVLVSHGAALRLIGGFLAENVTGSLANATHLPNTGRIVVVQDDTVESGWRCLEWTGHEIPA
ncbi:histidine phosphatase family protein [Actinoalloteichus hymeniacidonis]|uniref:Fructose-2,6-bisphosphatase n=1 Tax=Actinoalloteichus hymeniacidonis TaxID=340345 RepID=A0AAC9HKL4_9PSEU|nr:histidine phosphatase family protein [Actinoalloteichus hymeniacidonis]AOS60970.1 fructose-2,6-bisphosphatase [Actinoalloteichus hymeniacidonis]MBB5911030.1 putative phosphoglycerate mutase [Actinoalloteichus hymeniacidonis]